MPATSREMQRFLDSLEPDIRRAFESAISIQQNRANISQLEEAIDTLNYLAIFQASGASEAAWARVTEAVRESYVKSGRFTIDKEVPKRFGLDFNIENQRARDWIRTHSTTLIQDMTTQQQGAIRSAVTAGFEQGRNPRDIALDIVGRKSRQTGRRQGGVIGLTREFADYANNMRDDLATLNPRYFQKTRRDKRFDSIVRRAIEEGKPLTKAKINQLVTSYENRLLKTRGDNIARTEALSSMNAAAEEAMNQTVEELGLPPEAIENEWDATFHNTRESHVIANGQRVQHGELFTVGGYQMAHPGDSSHGAPAKEIVNCACQVRRNIRFELVP